ncbi:ATP-dependent DNA helicase [Microbacterium gorillae]|uniref:ATP-dependent DNA helicase n=1 Tax=Microbacterium gorillae TaxID=1231063 RepID=UPI003D950FBD
MTVAAIAELIPTESRGDLTADPLGLLTAAVRVATGNPEALPRPGQASLRRDIDAAIGTHTACVAVAPTGSGKSLATLTAAFTAAIEHDERTVLSTDSLALMGQLQDKDVHTVQAAAAALYPERPVTVAFVKGVANYVDPAKVIATAQTLTGNTNATSYTTLAEELTDGRRLKGLDQFPDAGSESAFRKLVVWALRQYTAQHALDVGDRHSCPIEHTVAAWQTVSSSSSEADDGSRYGVISKAQLAKDQGANADIIVTNHSILAVQAALGLPIIVGSSKFGPIDHIIVDEAHTLPGHVRSQGATKLSGGQILSIARQAYRAAGRPSGRLQRWNDEAETVARYVDQALSKFLAGQRDGVRRLGENDNPVGEIEEVVRGWAEIGAKALAPFADESDVSKRIKAVAVLDRIEKMRATVRSLTKHRTGWARWIEREQPRSDGSVWAAANISPISVGWMLNDNLWTTTDENGETYHLSVTALSATLPINYAQQAGLTAERRTYPSPFEDAYAGSALFIPQLESEAELHVLTREGYRNRRSFDSSQHPAWAMKIITDLVRANRGRALVLAAKAADGKMYAEHLRRALPHLTIHSQWDGGTTSRLVTDWREDVASVLVGTKSLMTGVDVSGEGNSLVIVDRIPRSPSNPIDDARVEELEARTGDRWAADRFVYAVDAALLLCQAAGRLIRHTEDRGMVAVLDPRLLKGPGGKPGPITYPEPTRQIYMEALYPFGQKFAARDQAIAWLEARP